MMPIRTSFRASLLAVSVLAPTVLVTSAQAQNSTVVDFQKLANMTHAQHVKLLGKPTGLDFAELPGKPMIYSEWTAPGKYLWLKINYNYRDGKPGIMSALLDGGRSPQDLMKAFNVPVGPNPSKQEQGQAIILKNTAVPVPKTQFTKVYLRRSGLQLWDKDKHTAKVQAGTLLWKISINIARPRRGNVMGGG